MISVWLTPVPRDRSALSVIVANLAAQFGAPTFEPHVTVAAGDAGGEAVADSLRAIAKRARPIRLTATGISVSPTFTNGFYADLSASEDFRHLVDSVVACHSGMRCPHVDPRLSLLYLADCEVEKRRTSRLVEIASRTFEFDALSVVRMRDVTASKADVEDWHVEATIPLLLSGRGD